VHQICFRPGLRPGPRWGSLQRSSTAGGAYSAPPDPLAGLRGPTSKGRGEERKRREGRGEERERERKGEWKGRGGGRKVKTPPPPIPAYAPDAFTPTVIDKTHETAGEQSNSH